MKNSKRSVVLLLLVVISVVLCSCGSDYHENLPSPFSDLRPDMTKEEVKNQFASLGIKDAPSDSLSDDDFVIENVVIGSLSGTVGLEFDDNDKLESCNWHSYDRDGGMLKRSAEEIQMAFMGALGEPKEGFSGTYFNDELTWYMDREYYSITYYNMSGSDYLSAYYSVSDSDKNSSE